MSGISRDIQVLQKIINYCDEIDEAVDHFEDSCDAMKKISAYKNAVCMCVLQIGELSGHLSDEFKSKYRGVPWKQIKGMRNLLAHRYGQVDVEELWNTIKNDIPTLCIYCREIIAHLSECAEGS